MPKREIQKWIDELRSGKWKQGRLLLGNNGKFCCLGVACAVFAPEHFLDEKKPLESMGAPSWLACVRDDFEIKTGACLIELNDDHGFTFDDIADLLQAVYIDEVLG